MRTALLGIIAGTGILLGFAFAGCALLMTGLAVYEAFTENLGTGFELLLQSWPFYLGAIIALSAAYYGYKSQTRAADALSA